MAGGRPKGSTNRQSQAIKDMLRASLDRVGGIDYFVKQAEENPTSYMAMISKTIPADVAVTLTHTFFDQNANGDDDNS